MVSSTDLIQLQSQSALLVGCIVLVHQTLGSGLVDGLHCDLVSALGLGAIALLGSILVLVFCSLQLILVGLVASVTDLTDEDTLLGRLDIRQTKHLPGDKFSCTGT